METKRVLIVDDEPIIVGLLKNILRRSGFLTESAYNGEEALSKIEEFGPHLVILDVMMPGKYGGYEVCEMIKTDPKYLHIYVLMLSAKGQAQEVQSGLDAGADEYIIKPFDIKEVLNKVKIVANSH